MAVLMMWQVSVAWEGHPKSGGISGRNNSVCCWLLVVLVVLDAAAAVVVVVVVAVVVLHAAVCAGCVIKYCVKCSCARYHITAGCATVATAATVPDIY